jgi:nucleoside phosphorylase/CheY-like chemotaxis protein
MSASRARKRVLVVENDPDVREATKDTLDLEGYQVYAAEGDGEVLVQQAHRLLKVHRCHAIILDLRLFSDNDPDDMSGFEFARDVVTKRYPWVACMLLTGYGSFELARQTLTGPDAVAAEIVLKEQGPQALVDAVDRVFSRHIKRRWDQRLDWVGDLDLEKVLTPLVHLDAEQKSSEIAQSEFKEILGRLFPDADRLRLAKLSDHEKSTSLTQGRSILLRVEPRQKGRWLEDVAVKIGDRETIQREIESYDRYVKGQLGHHRHTARQACAVTWCLGGIVYTLIGAELDRAKTLKEFYRQAELDGIKELGNILDRLFGQLFHRWYGSSEQEHLNLWNEYCETLGLSEERLSRLEWGKSAWVEFAGLSRPLLNPLRWIEKHAANSDVKTCRHTTHGDLHSRNIFVGPNLGVWLIDFERTGVGHGLRDLIELETDVKFSLLSLEESDTRLFYNFESRLLTQDTSVAAQDIHPPLDVSRHSQANLAFQAIAYLRRLAAGKAYPDMRDYYWGLLCQTLFVATLSHLPDEARRRAKLSAALICERLGDGRRLLEPWPPNNPLYRQKDPDASVPVAQPSTVQGKTNESTNEKTTPTIGIITALEKEYAAVEVLLENSKEIYVPGQGAGRRYMSGEIPVANDGRHAVLLALAGMGTSPAAARTIRLLDHFQTVKSIFMVGIAGGIPYPEESDEHVRLGDVVVSNQMGVIQYDLVKETKDAIIYRPLPRPPSPILLEAVMLLKAAERKGERPWLKYIDQAAHRLKVTRPLEKTDFLGSPDNPAERIPHPKDPQRQKGQPRIFIGAIASSNTLLQDPIKRDQLRVMFQVRAVEMEGAGIADATWSQEVGYLVVRGICDYCDSNKGDAWQEYAAVVAAAYTRALIESIPL